MQMIIDFLLGSFAEYLPIFVFWAIFIFTVFKYSEWLPAKLKDFITFKTLTIFTVAFKIFYVFFLSFGQYYVWAGGEKALSVFANSPLSDKVPESFITQLFPAIFNGDHGYFYFYAYGRFFINLFLAVGIAFLFWTFLKLLKKYQERFFETGEAELGFLAALIVGWPNFLAFIPLVFVSIIAASIFRGIFLKEPYTTMGAPFLLAAFICLIWGEWLIQILNLTVFRI